MAKTLIARMPSNPHLTTYAAYFGVHQPMPFHGVVHESDLYADYGASLEIEAMERNEYPEPTLVRGTLHLDENRPGMDAGSDHRPHTVVIEIRAWRPESLVYLKDRYASGVAVKILEGPTDTGLQYEVMVDGEDFSVLNLDMKTPVRAADLPELLKRLSQRFGVNKESVPIQRETEFGA